MKRPEPGAAGAVGEERLEDALGIGRIDAGAAVGHLEERPVRSRRCGRCAARTGSGRRRRRASARCRRGSTAPGAGADGSNCTSSAGRRAALENDAPASSCSVARNSARNVSSHADRSIRSCRVVSLRDSCSTFSMIWLTRTAFFSMMSVRCRSSGPSAGDSLSSCPAWLIAPTGLRISCAMLALSRPSEASFDCCTRSATTLVSSRNTSTGPGRAPTATRSAAGSRCRRPRTPPRPSSRAGRGPAAARPRAGRAAAATPRPAGAGAAPGPVSRRAAVSLISRMRSSSSTTRMLSRRCCTMNWFSSLRLARSMSRCCTSASLSRSRFASGMASSVIANRLAPVRPATRKSAPGATPAAPRRGLEQQPDRDHRRGEQRQPRLDDGRGGAHGQEQQRGEAAADAAARVDQQRDGDAVHGEREQRHPLAPGQRRWIGWMQTRPKVK